MCLKKVYKRGLGGKTFACWLGERNYLGFLNETMLQKRQSQKLQHEFSKCTIASAGSKVTTTDIFGCSRLCRSLRVNSSYHHWSTCIKHPHYATRPLKNNTHSTFTIFNQFIQEVCMTHDQKWWIRNWKKPKWQRKYQLMWCWCHYQDWSAAVWADRRCLLHVSALLLWRSTVA